MMIKLSLKATRQFKIKKNIKMPNYNMNNLKMSNLDYNVNKR